MLLKIIWSLRILIGSSWKYQIRRGTPVAKLPKEVVALFKDSSVPKMVATQWQVMVN